MKLNERKAAKYGLPEGFLGEKIRISDVDFKFTMEKAVLLREDEKNDDGEVMISPRTGKPFNSWQVVLMLCDEKGKDWLVWTNSPPIVRFFRSDIIDSEQENTFYPPDGKNRYGRDFWNMEPVEGLLCFETVKEPYGKDRKMYDVPDFAEAD